MTRSRSRSAKSSQWRKPFLRGSLVWLKELESVSVYTYILRCSSPECRSIQRRICVYRNTTTRLGHRHIRLHRVRNEADLMSFMMQVVQFHPVRSAAYPFDP